MLRTFLLLVLLTLGGLGDAQGQTTVYNFQVGTNNVTYAGTGALGQGGTVFNRVDYTGVGQVNAVADAKNFLNGTVAPGVSLSFTADGRFDAGANDGFGNPTAKTTVATDDTALLQNFATERNGATGMITLTGLPASTPFTIVLYGTNGVFSDGTRGTKFTLYKDATLHTVKATATTTCATDAHFGTPGNCVLLKGTSDPGGCVYAVYTAGVGDEGDFNGLQIEVGKP